jgi:NAD(P)-dependent dehydrogenase (short-subunit alcohol dehydrogenase family)
MTVLALNDLATRLPSLEGRVAAVGGGAAGSGRASAELLARLGAAVGVLDVDRDRAEAVAADIRDAGGRALALVADVSSEAALERAAIALDDGFGPCEILVNAAGAAAADPLEEIAPEDWDRMIDVELTGAFLCMQVFGRRMLAQSGGAVVNVCAAHGEGPLDHLPGAAGRTMLSRLGAVEWGARGVRVNSVHVGRRADPAAVAAAVAFLSGDGSSYVTGESFEVNEEVPAR